MARLGSRDLHSRVNLDKVVAVLLVDQELSGTSIAVVDRLGKTDGILEDGIAGLLGEILGRRNLDDLLVAALDTAVTLVEVHDVAVVVAKQLDLDVLGLVEEALDEDGAVAEGRLGLRCRALESVLELGLLADDTHTTAATAKRSLDDDGEAKLIGEGLHVLELLDGVGGAGHHGHVALDGESAGGDLVAEGVNGVWRRANKLSNTRQPGYGPLEL
jgi:hypothetical protein